MGWFASWLLSGIVTLVQTILDALATAASAILSLLPAMPSLPSLPTPFITAESWVAWFFPVGTVVDVLATVLTLWVIWFVAAIGLKWARIIGSNA